MPAVGIDVVTAAVLVVCMIAFATIAKISRLAKAALVLGSLAALVTALLAIPLVGLGIFIASLIFAVADRRVRVHRGT